MIFKLLPLYLSNREERTPKRQLGPFVTAADTYARPPASGLRVTWFGHSIMLVEIDGVRVLIDPVWDERASPMSWAGPKRFFPSPLPLEKMPELDVILFSHDHYDHMGKETVRALAALPAAAGAQWVVPLEVGAVLRSFGAPAEKIIELDWTESAEMRSARTGASLRITAIPSRHFSGRSMRNRFETLWASYALKGAEHNVYYGADSGYWDGYTEIGQHYGPFDLTMLEVGAWNVNWESIHMGPDGAMRAFRAMGAHGLLMPIHWGLFDLALHAWRFPIERITELADADGIPLWSPPPGVPTEFEKGVELRSSWWR
ncbi:MBL fold metallo-hydrolase [Silvibacterium dinghuense]|uniref:MBL fold metallo-hydrolase n=2 Tax=Silvibacterium dinghuense TaxID=1560006 RepID=A0A4V1NW46_9BACT|nr:MBL fold metallo-hydrolase [Silvibacterium dinghuense]